MVMAAPRSSEFWSSADSVSSPPSYAPGTPSSAASRYGPPLMMTTGAPFFLGFGFGVGGESYNPSSAEYYEEYTPASPTPRAGSPDYTPRSGSRAPRAVSPDYTPESPASRALSLDYTPASPSPRALSPDYSPSSPAPRAWSLDYTPSSPPPPAGSPDYTPSTPSSRAASPDYTPSTPPPSPQLVSDAESRTSPAPRRNHPYQRSAYSSCSSRASRISGGHRQRALGY